MIYTGSDEIRGIMLGNDEIPGIYVGSEQIYPMTISGFKVRPLSLSFSTNGGSKNISIVSEYNWTATTPDSWITLSAASGQSGRTSLSVTVGPNQTGGDISGTVVVTSTDLQHSATIDIIQKMEYIPTGYLEYNGMANVNTSFNPYQIYASNDYMRLELQADLYTGYLWYTNNSWPWFSFETTGGNDRLSYQNIGNSTALGTGYSWNTSGTASTSVFTYDNNIWTMTKGNQTQTGSWSGDFDNNNLVIFGGYSNPLGVFYRLKVFDSPSASNPVYDFCPALDGNNTASIFEAVNGIYLYPSGEGTITFVSF